MTTANEAPARGPGTAEGWSEFLEQHLECRVGVVFGRSRTYPIQVHAAQAAPRRATGMARPRPGLVVRMHSMFADASAEVADSVARWIRSGRRAQRACSLLDRWIEDRMAQLPARRAASRALQPHGEVHDLEQLAGPLLGGPLAGDFGPEDPPPALTWGRRARSSTRRSLRLGSFDLEAGLVRLHPVLDQRGVPRWFVRYVLFHELLHAALPPVRGRGSRWIHHGAEFRRRERAYPDYRRALAWEEENLPRLIRSARSGTQMRVRDQDEIAVQGRFDFGTGPGRR